MGWGENHVTGVRGLSLRSFAATEFFNALLKLAKCGKETACRGLNRQAERLSPKDRAKVGEL